MPWSKFGRGRWRSGEKKKEGNIKVTRKGGRAEEERKRGESRLERENEEEGVLLCHPGIPPKCHPPHPGYAPDAPSRFEKGWHDNVKSTFFR